MTALKIINKIFPKDECAGKGVKDRCLSASFISVMTCAACRAVVRMETFLAFSRSKTENGVEGRNGSREGSVFGCSVSDFLSSSTSILDCAMSLSSIGALRSSSLSGASIGSVAGGVGVAVGGGGLSVSIADTGGAGCPSLVVGLVGAGRGSSVSIGWEIVGSLSVPVPIVVALVGAGGGSSVIIGWVHSSSSSSSSCASSFSSASLLSSSPEIKSTCMFTHPYIHVHTNL